MAMRYIKVTLGNKDEIFVREKDFRKLGKSFKLKDPHKVVAATIGVLLGSPEGLTKLSQGTNAAMWIMECGRKKEFNTLHNLKNLIDYELGHRIKIKGKIIQKKKAVKHDA